jgi:PAS domain S-box-containing protein
MSNDTAILGDRRELSIRAAPGPRHEGCTFRENGAVMEQLETRRYDRAFASLPEPTLLVDEEGRLLLVNAAGESLLGAEVSRSAGRNAAVSRALPWLGPALERVLAGDDEAALEAKIATPDGSRSVTARLRRVRERGGRPYGVVVVLEDVTEKRALEAHRRSAERLAALGTLAADLAHEVNSPLACVVAGLSFLESEHARIASALGPAELVEAKLALEEARDAALRVGRIVHSLQSLGRPATPFLQEIDLSIVLHRAMRLAETELRGRARLIADVAEVKARASESLLVELFLALIVHAAQSLEPGVAASVIHVSLLAENGEVCAVVSTQGVGSGDVDARGSAPASRPGPAATPCLVGQGIVTALGGTLAVERSPGGAAAITVRLPLELA